MPWAPRIRNALHGTCLALVSLCLLGHGFGGSAMAQTRPTLNFNGVPGLIDMPVGSAAPDGEFSFTVSRFGGITRGALSFQIFPRIGGTFRYVEVQNWNSGGFATYYDRNFDLRLQVLDEGRYLPGVTVGLQDFIGTGLYSGEYIAASKTLRPGLTVTGGLGWGRLGSYNAIGTPFGKRPRIVIGRGGKPNAGQWFRGDVAPFAGVEWQINDKLGFKLEYSSDAYVKETVDRNVFERRSPWNFGLEYQATPATRIGLYSLYGSEIGASVSFAIDPKSRPRNLGMQGPAPLPVKQRPDPRTVPDAWSPAWASQPTVTANIQSIIAQGLALDGMELEALSLQPTTVQVRLRNTQFGAESQAFGRAARLLTQVLPASVEVFEIVPVVNGVPVSKITFRRSDIEALEMAPNGSAQLLARTKISDAGPLPAGSFVPPDAYPKLKWSFGPYTRLSLFDPSNPVRADLGLRLMGEYRLAPWLRLNGSLTQKVVGSIGDAKRGSNSVLPHVRSDTVEYDKFQGVALENLTLSAQTRLAPDLYGRLTLGYLERMYGGVSGEVLWKPVNSRLALGVEANYVAQRNFEQDLGFKDYRIATGHVSAYYDFGNGYLGQVDVGRYLAGDVGTTLTLDRQFPNGWRLGAFATFTNVSAERFGEGSFDKGIRLTAPLSWITGQVSRWSFNTTIRPLTRDGGARVSVNGRLYETVRSYHKGGVDPQWGRVFR
jgi:Exopolysaccharide biosynthesis protein YbjH